MTQPIEPTFADVLQAIANDKELTEQKRRHWQTSLKSAANALGRPVESIPARLTAIWTSVLAVHHLPMGWTPKTWSNHKSNVKAALLRFAKETQLPPRGVPLTAAWQMLCDRLEKFTRRRLTALVRFCSANATAPDDVTEAVLDSFADYRSRTTGKTFKTGDRRVIARCWNASAAAIEGWPDVRLIEAPSQKEATLKWAEFPKELRKGIDGYLASLTKVRRDKRGRRKLPCKTSTILRRRRTLEGVVRKAVAGGIPLGSLKSLKGLIYPTMAERIYELYWPSGQQEAPLYLLHLSTLFIEIGFHLGLRKRDIEKLRDLTSNIYHQCLSGITEKNLQLIREVLTDGVWNRVVSLPHRLMEKARRQRHAPMWAAVAAQIAVAIAILTVAPVRLANLQSIRLGYNLTRPGGPGTQYYLTFHSSTVKNKVDLQFPLGMRVTSIIDEYVQEFRPQLMRGHNADWLFPGENGKAKNMLTLSGQIGKRIVKATGLRITVHQFRHAAGALILKDQPGNYELVRRILGHKGLKTTIAFYCSLETTQASEILSGIVTKKLEPEDA